MARIAIYAGSFDPPTNGHRWMICRGAALFDTLVVALAVNPDKHGFLTLPERRRALELMLADLPSNVKLATVQSGFLVDFAREAGASFLLRGVRNTIDFEYEKPMARINARMEPEIQTVFLMPPSELEEVSSTFVRSFIGMPGWKRWVRSFVPPCVFSLIERRQAQQ